MGKLIIGGISLIFTIWFSNLLDPLFVKFNQYLIEKSIAPISFMVILVSSILNIRVPVYSILLFGIIAWFVYKVFRPIVSSHRKFKIVKADYGSGTKLIDITDQLNNLVVDNKLKIKLSNGISGLDPTPGTLKTGRIKYQLNNKIFERKYLEGNIINLP